MPALELSFASGDHQLSVRRFSAREGLSTLFGVSVEALTPNPDIDLEAIVGRPAGLRVAYPTAGERTWVGVCTRMEAAHAEPTGLSSYAVHIAPALWLLTRGRNHRVFQHASIPEIAGELLSAWGIDFAWRIDRSLYPKLEYRVQYGESDFAFLSRLLEEAGIGYFFEDVHPLGEPLDLVESRASSRPQSSSRLILGDALHQGRPRPGPAILFLDNPSESAGRAFVTRVSMACEVRSGAQTIRDYDFRNPAFPLFGQARDEAGDDEARYEQYGYEPGAFVVETEKGGDTPIADDRGTARSSQQAGHERAARILAARRADRRVVSFETNLLDLAPGTVFAIAEHPRRDLHEDRLLLGASLALEGGHDVVLTVAGHALLAERPYRPPLSTPKPRCLSVQSATVVGPAGEEIHTDEYGRVRVQFPWDRLGTNDEKSSCWIRVSQGWAGTGFGMIVLPRIGQEVLVGFLEGDPDQPIVVGRVYNATQIVPYKLPDNKTKSTWKSDSSPSSDGFNELMFEDAKGSELVYLQAQRDLRKLVKNNEFHTTLMNRIELTGVSRTEVTGAVRTQATGLHEIEIVGFNRTVSIGANLSELVKADETERIEGHHLVYVAKDHDHIVGQAERKLVKADSHLHVGGGRRERIDKTRSLTVGEDQEEKVGKVHVLDAGSEIHLKSGGKIVIEAAQDLTVKGPGGFVRIDAGGVTIRGTLVKINSGGSAGSGSESKPEAPEEAKEAKVTSPLQPDLKKLGL